MLHLGSITGKQNTSISNIEVHSGLAICKAAFLFEVKIFISFFHLGNISCMWKIFQQNNILSKKLQYMWSRWIQKKVKI